MTNLILSLILLFTVLQLPAAEPEESITLTILYDNYLFDEDFQSSWGFACLIEGPGQNILFDCGGGDGLLMDNFRSAGIDPATVDLVVLSHIHDDHTGGLPHFLEVQSGIEVWMPASFPDEFFRFVSRKGARPVSVTGPAEIFPGVWTTGEMGKQIIEQSLVLETAKGLVVITGCAHPGIEEIVDRAADLLDREILLVMGGFHLLRTPGRQVEEIAHAFKDAGVRCVAPTHCSGDRTREIFEEVFGENFIPVGCGKVVRLNELLFF